MNRIKTAGGKLANFAESRFSLLSKDRRFFVTMKKFFVFLAAFAILEPEPAPFITTLPLSSTKAEEELNKLELSISGSQG